MGRFCWIATRAQSEILGLVPSNPRHNTSKQILEVLRRGTKAAPSSHFGATFSFNHSTSGTKAAPWCHFVKILSQMETRITCQANHFNRA